VPENRPRRSARRVALRALQRIGDGAYANLVVPALLGESGLDERDRAFVTELVYGTTRMCRACDWLIDRHLRRPVSPEVRAVLRLGTYQLAWLGTPPHAAVSATVDEAPPPARGLVNAVLRKVAGQLGDPQWPDMATELSYPDWVVDVLDQDLGPEAARAALETMNRPALVTERPDGYVQDEASQQVAAFVGAGPGERIFDACAGPGGKATFLAEAGPGLVVAGDVQARRAGLVAANARRLGVGHVATVQADGRRPPFPDRQFDRVLVDAPCSGLGVLRRRPDARWRVRPEDVPRLQLLQRQLVEVALTQVRPGGVLVYSVCTLTAAETAGVDNWLASTWPDWRPVPPPGPPWEPAGRGARVLPQTAGTDGMFVLGVRARG
jgi:16S rRNA (cytosine967-C5)-methyltransferase